MRKIVTAALKIFSKEGFENTTFQQIAESMDMTGPSIYHYFSTKNALLFACIESVLQELTVRLQAVADSDDLPMQRIERAVREQVAMEISRSVGASVVNAYLYGPRYLSTVLSPAQTRQLSAMQRDVADCYRRMIEDACANAEIKVDNVGVTVLNILAIVQYTGVWYRSSGALKGPQIGALQAQMVVSMLRGQSVVGTN